jgi:ferredoxin
VRIDVDWDLCEGHGVCAATAPELFEVTDADKVRVLNSTPPAALTDSAAAAARGCPRAALTLTSLG